MPYKIVLSQLLTVVLEELKQQHAAAAAAAAKLKSKNKQWTITQVMRDCITVHWDCITAASNGGGFSLFSSISILTFSCSPVPGAANSILWWNSVGIVKMLHRFLRNRLIVMEPNSFALMLSSFP